MFLSKAVDGVVMAPRLVDVLVRGCRDPKAPLVRSAKMCPRWEEDIILTFRDMKMRGIASGDIMRFLKPTSASIVVPEHEM